MALLLTSSSLARSLIRILLIRPFVLPDCAATSSYQPHDVGSRQRAVVILGTRDHIIPCPRKEQNLLQPAPRSLPPLRPALPPPRPRNELRREFPLRHSPLPLRPPRERTLRQAQLHSPQSPRKARRPRRQLPPTRVPLPGWRNNYL